MPTTRAVVIFILAVALYLVANQTQVGWVYIMTNALLGVLGVAWVYSWGMLKSIRGQRAFRPLRENYTGHPPGVLLPPDPLTPPDFFEDDPIEISLRLEQSRLKPVFLVSGAEVCPFAPPDEQRQPFFVSRLFKNKAVELTYQTHCDRRGQFSFPAIPLRSAGPFSLFRSRGKLPAAGELLVYPAYHPLTRLRLLESRGFTDKQTLRVGAGSEIIGTREYRPGDTLRQIHWRSTARAGRLVVKEFADTDHLTITVVLDLSTQGSVGKGKLSTFETAIRVAATVGYYATRREIPFQLAGHSPKWQPPALALSWWGVLHYLARVQNDGSESLARVLRNLPPTPFAVVIVSHPAEATAKALTALSNRGIYILSIFITPDGSTPPSALNLASETLQVKTVSPCNWAKILETL